MGNVRVMFTVVDADGDERDVILHVDAGTRVSEVARLLGAERLYAGQAPLVPADDGPALLVRRPPRLLSPTPAVTRFALPAPPAGKPLATGPSSNMPRK